MDVFFWFAVFFFFLQGSYLQMPLNRTPSYLSSPKSTIVTQVGTAKSLAQLPSQPPCSTAVFTDKHIAVRVTVMIRAKNTYYSFERDICGENTRRCRQNDEEIRTPAGRIHAKRAFGKQNSNLYLLVAGPDHGHRLDILLCRPPPQTALPTGVQVCGRETLQMPARPQTPPPP